MLELILLGEAALRRDGVPISLRNAKAYALLAYLAANPRGRGTVPDIADLLWPTSSDALARHSISQILYSIHRLTGRKLLLRRGDFIQLDTDAVRCDLLEFDGYVREGAWDQALRRYGGPFLDGLRVSADERFEQWRDGVAARCSGQFRSCVRAMAEVGAVVSPAEVEDWTGRVLERDPLIEDVAAMHCRALAEQGRTREAEVKLHEYLVQHAPDLSPVAVRELEDLARSLAAGAHIESSGTQNLRLSIVGRARDLQELRSACVRAANGEMSALLVQGDPGIGKSRMLEQLARFAAIRGARIISGAGSPACRRVPYHLASELFGTVLATEDPRRTGYRFLRRMLGCAQTPDLPERADDWARDQAAYNEAHVLLTAHAAHRPVLVVVDDLQWADDSSFELLQYLCFRCAAAPVVFAFGIRPEGSERAAQLQDVCPCAVFELEPLSPNASEQLLEQYCANTGRAFEPRIARQLLTRAAGNPFFLLALADDTPPDSATRPIWDVPSLPESVRALIVARTRRLSTDALDVLRILAALRTAEPIEVIARIAELNALRIAKGVEELVRLHLATDAAGTIRPSHDLIADAIYDATPESVKRMLHCCVARVLCDRGNGFIALHAYRAGNMASAFEAASLAAVEARGLRAYAEAEFYHRLALNAASTRSEAARASAAYLTYVCALDRPEASIDHVALAREHFAATNDDPGLLRCAAVEVEHEMRAGTMPLSEAARRTTALIDEALELGDTRLAAEITSILSRVTELGCDSTTISKWLEHATSIAERVDANWRISLWGKACVVSYYAFGPGHSDEISARLLGLAAEDSRHRALALGYRGTALMLSGRLEEAAVCLREAVELAQDPVLSDAYMKACVSLAVLEIDVGQYDSARQRLLSVRFDPYRSLVSHVNLGFLGLESGDLDTAVWAAEHLRERSRTLKAPVLEAAVPCITGLVAWERGDYQAAAAAADLLDPFVDSISLRSDDSYFRILLARVRGRENAAAALRVLSEPTRAIRPAVPQLRIDLERGRMLARMDIAEAAASLRAVAGRAEAMGAVPIAQRARLTLSELIPQ